MPQFKVAKTKDIAKIKNNEKTIDKLYIYRQANRIGKLYYIYDKDTKLEINPPNKIYYCDTELNNDKISVGRELLQEINWNSNSPVHDINTVLINSLVISKNNKLYSVIDYNNNFGETSVVLKLIYADIPLKWNDYYE